MGPSQARKSVFLILFELIKATQLLQWQEAWAEGGGTALQGEMQVFE